MKRYTLLYISDKVAAVALLLFWLFAVVNCSSESGDSPDIPEEPKLCTVTISLQAPSSMNPATKASGEEVSTGWATEEDELEYERNISNWIVVAYGADGKYAGHVSSTTYNDSDKDSETMTTMELPEGKYNFYAFANLESVENGNDVISKITTGKSDESYVKELAVNIGDLSAKFNTTTPENKKLIPMSSYAQTHTIAQNYEVSIPLIRMVGKVKVTVSNGLDQAIEISNLTLEKFRRNGQISLLPWGANKYLEFDGVDPNKNYGPDFGNITYDSNNAHTYVLLGDNKVEMQSNAMQEYTCYVEETRFTDLNSTKGLLVNLEIEGRDNIVGRETNFDFIRRNDYLEIPLLVTKLDGKITIGDMRLPIAVYPTDYIFGAEGDVQILTPITHHLQSAGDLVIKYELTAPIAGKAWAIKYRRPGTSYPETEVFSRYTLMPSQSGGNLLIDRETNEALTGIKTIYDFDSSESTSGSFTIRTQELGNTATATIRLTLIVEYGETGEDGKMKKEGEIEIPYTINLTNAPASGNTSGN